MRKAALISFSESHGSVMLESIHDTPERALAARGTLVRQRAAARVMHEQAQRTKSTTVRPPKPRYYAVLDLEVVDDVAVELTPEERNHAIAFGVAANVATPPTLEEEG